MYLGRLWLDISMGISDDPCECSEIRVIVSGDSVQYDGYRYCSSSPECFEYESYPNGFRDSRVCVFAVGFIGGVKWSGSRRNSG